MKNFMSGLLKKNMVAIDIGSYSIKIVEGSCNMNSVQIDRVTTVPTPSDAFYDGKFADANKIEQAINEILKQENIRTKNVAFTLESTDAISREIVLPWVKLQELEQIIRFEVEQYLPIEMDKYILQYKIINEFEENDVKKVIVLAVALPKLIGEAYLDLAKNMRLNPHYLDIHSNCVHKLLLPKTIVNDSYPLENQTIAAIDMGHQFINITIIDKGQFKFSRLLNIGGKDIDMNISDLFNISSEEAEVKKEEIKNVSRDTEQDDSITLTDTVRETVTDWLEDIQKIFRYYTSRSTENIIDSICIYGGSSNIEGISTYIQQFFNMPALKINSLNNVKFNDSSEEISISDYVNAIGSIIRR